MTDSVQSWKIGIDYSSLKKTGKKVISESRSSSLEDCSIFYTLPNNYVNHIYTNSMNEIIPFHIGGVSLNVWHFGSEGDNKHSDSIDLDGITAQKLHIMQFGGCIDNIPNGVKAGSIKIYYEDGTYDSMYLIVGKNTAEWAYDRPELQNCLKHTKIPPAFSILTDKDSNYFYLAHHFAVSIDLKNIPLDRLKLILSSDSYTGQTTCYSRGDFSSIGISGITLDINICDKLLYICEFIFNLPDNVFRNNPNQYRNAFCNKFNAINSMIETGNFKGAINKLELDVLSKTDGCIDGKTPDDWIIDCASQEKLHSIILKAIEELKRLQ